MMWTIVQILLIIILVMGIIILGRYIYNQLNRSTKSRLASFYWRRLVLVLVILFFIICAILFFNIWVESHQTQLNEANPSSTVPPRTPSAADKKEAEAMMEEIWGALERRKAR